MAKPPYNVTFHHDALADLNKISVRGTIVKAIENRLGIDPSSYGNRLKKSLRGFWKLRVGDYRVVFSLTGKKVLMLAVGHRKEIYDLAKKRIVRKIKDI